MSPGCCAQQLLHEASIHCGWANQPGAVGVQCVRGLTACELAVAMEPDLWWQVSLMSGLCRLVKFGGAVHGHTPAPAMQSCVAMAVMFLQA